MLLNRCPVEALHPPCTKRPDSVLLSLTVGIDNFSDFSSLIALGRTFNTIEYKWESGVLTLPTSVEDFYRGIYQNNSLPLLVICQVFLVFKHVHRTAIFNFNKMNH